MKNQNQLSLEYLATAAIASNTPKNQISTESVITQPNGDGYSDTSLDEFSDSEIQIVASRNPHNEISETDSEKEEYTLISDSEIQIVASRNPHNETSETDSEKEEYTLTSEEENFENNKKRRRSPKTKKNSPINKSPSNNIVLNSIDLNTTPYTYGKEAKTLLATLGEATYLEIQKHVVEKFQDVKFLTSIRQYRHRSVEISQKGNVVSLDHIHQYIMANLEETKTREQSLVINKKDSLVSLTGYAVNTLISRLFPDKAIKRKPNTNAQLYKKSNKRRKQSIHTTSTTEEILTTEEKKKFLECIKEATCEFFSQKNVSGVKEVYASYSISIPIDDSFSNEKLVLLVNNFNKQFFPQSEFKATLNEKVVTIKNHGAITLARKFGITNKNRQISKPSNENIETRENNLDPAPMTIESVQTINTDNTRTLPETIIDEPKENFDSTSEKSVISPHLATKKPKHNDDELLNSVTETKKEEQHVFEKQRVLIEKVIKKITKVTKFHIHIDENSELFSDNVKGKRSCFTDSKIKTFFTSTTDISEQNKLLKEKSIKKLEEIKNSLRDRLYMFRETMEKEKEISNNNIVRLVQK